MAARPPVGSKLRTLSPGVLRARVRLSVSHEYLLRATTEPSELLLQLQDQGLASEAISLLSHALPEREAVWWACMCILHTSTAPLPAEQVRALAFSQDWVRTPTEKKRCQAAAVVKEAGYFSAAAFTARAVFVTDLSDPAGARAGRRVEGAVRRAAQGNASQTDTRLRRCIASGQEIARGGSGRLPKEAEQ